LIDPSGKVVTSFPSDVVPQNPQLVSALERVLK
jgi:hypothetical protein